MNEKDKIKIEYKKMEKRELISKEIENIPEPYLTEIMEFIQFLKGKSLEQKIEPTLQANHL